MPKLRLLLRSPLLFPADAGTFTGMESLWIKHVPCCSCAPQPAQTPLRSTPRSPCTSCWCSWPPGCWWRWSTATGRSPGQTSSRQTQRKCYGKGLISPFLHDSQQGGGGWCRKWWGGLVYEPLAAVLWLPGRCWWIYCTLPGIIKIKPRVG